MRTAAANRFNYESGRATYGSVAYDLDYLEDAAERAAERVARPRTVPGIRRQEKTRARVRVREQQSVSIFAVVGFLTVMVLLVLMLLSYVKITELSASVVSLKSQLSILEVEEASLLAQYGTALDLSAIEEAAIAGGMAKPKSGQIFYLDLSGPDRAVIYEKQDEDGTSGMLKSLAKGFCTVVEYFK